jgi:hypothetical protein
MLLVNRVAGSFDCAVLVQSARATYSAHGATSLPQVGAVSESLEQRLLDSLQFPFAVSIKSERLKGSCINQSRIHDSIAGLSVSIKSSARLSRFAVSVCRTPSPGSRPQEQAANRHSLSAMAFVKLIRLLAGLTESLGPPVRGECLGPKVSCCACDQALAGPSRG